MRTKLISIIVFFLIQNITLSQEQISSEQWQNDLKYLQHTVNDNYPFLFKKVTSAKFNDEIEALYKAIPNLQPEEIPVAFSRIVSLFEYGHTQLPFGALADDGILPINIYEFSDGIYIEGAHKDYQSIIGGKLISIENMAIAEVLDLIRPVVPAENDSFFKAYGLRYALLPNVLFAQGVIKVYKTNITITVEKNGKLITETLLPISYDNYSVEYSFTKADENWKSIRQEGEKPLYLEQLDKVYYFTHLQATKTLYVRHSRIANDKTIDTKSFYKSVFDFADLNDVEKLVLDVRLNGGGNNYLNKPIITGLIGSKFNKKGKLFVIIGRRTFSACQNLINEFSNYTNVIFVGEPSAENLNFYGDTRKVVLPSSKLAVYLSFAWWQDKPQWENKEWTIPHIAVELDFKSYQNNNDPILEAVLNYKDSDFILDPMAHLTQLFTEGKFEEVKRDAKKIVNNPQYKYSNFEEEFLQAGNRLMGSGDLQARKSALFIFEMVTETYPKSISAYYSLANAQESLELIKEAIQSYKTIIELDPDNVLATIAANKIKELSNKR
ncbi:hypothetical protein RM697_09390 [Ichthyenterobacterium sp. W332]|uniref:Tail specific protease domain-containing protein n=1 Tax=Microcosmobacter mediterraneus TaxID=3075607 RepID=A0ABU2YL22_9FLAO|nr:hypothetical protein [Ichthyenterobacterium sp. W332]MDT0558862.1 hypothetical protein [Ichthyenterobacterium sp. W332]